MHRLLPLLVAAVFASRLVCQAGELRLSAPLEHSVTQRSSREKGSVRIAGCVEGLDERAVIEARTVVDGREAPWAALPAGVKGDEFDSAMEIPAGGWYRLEVRVTTAGQVIAEAAVEDIGVGEVFVVAGQSNSANHGEVKQKTTTGRVAAFDGMAWRIAEDPQPGASGKGGSFMPPFGDAMVQEFDVPVGIVACGLGGTSVREWLPKGDTFPNPPTVERSVERLPTGEWASKGAIFPPFVARLKALGPRGFRAVLWHQGESDANQKDPTRTLSGILYRQYLERIIRSSRTEIGWEAPWFVAQASYHVPGDEASPDIRAAQAALWQDGIAFQGPDTDALKGDLRERDGQGVHFSGKGLLEHGAKWAEKVGPWLKEQLATRP
ncbi:MAG: hypothetical protein H7A55_02750 [Verrucomicrobiaceae bacterium]|nr:hypothetical protein [Verrucomicrobiaceae bacterium]